MLVFGKIFRTYLMDDPYSEFSRSLENSIFPPTMKLANVTPVHKKIIVESYITIDLLAYYLTCQKFLKDVFITKYIKFLVRYSHNTNVVSVKVTVLSTI